MQLILDNLAASIVAATIFLILVAVGHRSLQAQVEARTFETLRKQQVAFTKMLRRDMVGVVGVEDTEEDPSDHTFTFYTRIGSDTTTRKITYKRRYVGVRDSVHLYQIQRYTYPSLTASFSNAERNGGSMSTLTSWTIEARNSQGNVPSSTANARQVYIRFEAIPHFGEEKPFKRRRWEATFRPRMLQASTLL